MSAPAAGSAGVAAGALEALTDYQRGNRDGLESLALRLEGEAAAVKGEMGIYEGVADRSTWPVQRNAARVLATRAAYRLEALDRAASLARLAALALPDDPGGAR